MWCHRRFTWQLRCDDDAAGIRWAAEVKTVLARLVTQTPQFYRDAQMSGLALGVLEFAVTISDRDQWWVARRARFLTDELRKHTSIPLALVSEDQAKLTPHGNRGKYRLRRRRRETSGG